MSKFVCYLRLKPYLQQWLAGKYGTPVRFPKGSYENMLFERFLSFTPANSEPDLPSPEKIAIQIPTFHGKNENYYNYLPPKGRKALARSIYIQFKMQLWEDIHTIDNLPGCLTDIIYAWMEKNGIEDTAQNWETIRQQYYRMRNSCKEEKQQKYD